MNLLSLITKFLPKASPEETNAVSLDDMSALSEETRSRLICEHYCVLPLDRLNRELAKFMVEFEKAGGLAPDPNRKYSSQLDTKEQLRLMYFTPEYYFVSLPPFVKAFMIKKMEEACSAGALDLMDKTYVSLWVKGLMRLETHEDIFRP